MNTIDLQGRTAVVTGGARGIGLATARRFLDSGAKVALWDQDAEQLERTHADLGGDNRVMVVPVDVSDPESVAHARADTLAGLGKLDIVVNSAGIAGHNHKIWETPIDEWRRVIDIDLTGVFLVCRTLVPDLIANGYGRIVNVASIAGKEGNANAGHYSSAKAGVIAMTKSLGKELVETGVLCNCIAPAVIDTEILGQVTEAFRQFMIEKVPLQRMGEAEEVAALITWLSSEDCSFSTGACYDISGGRATY